jgi:hypothetical protein
MSTEEVATGAGGAPVSKGPRRRRAGAMAARAARLVAPFAIGAALLFGVLLFTDQLSRRPTYGEIWIDSPEVYTRERLVNDRLLQDAWLRARLPGRDAGPSTYAGVQTSSTHTRTEVGVAAVAGPSPPAGAGDGAAARGKDSAEPARPAEASAAPPPASPPTSTAQSAQVSIRDRLAAEIDYRDYVRDLLIENQLDDRHDLQGNSLYKLKFDATVIPGLNTQATAQVTVKLIPPELGTTAWKKTYDKWIESLESRLNAAHRELRLAYDNDRLSYDEYARMFQFVQSVREANAGAARIPAACPESMLRPAEQNLYKRPEPSEQRARKACLQAFVRDHLSRTNPGERVGGSYENKLSASDLGASSLELETNRLINKFFAAKAVQLVLGISLADSSFVDNSGDYAVRASSPELHKLVQLALLYPKFESSYGRVFSVLPKVVDVAAIGAAIDSEKAYGEAIRDNPDFEMLTYDAFVLDEASGLRIDRVSYDALKEAGYRINPATDLKLHPASAQLMTGSIALGYFSFRNKAEPLWHTYTYAVTPKERADIIDTELRSGSSARATTRAQWEASVAASTNYEGSARALRGFVVGFAGPVSGGGSTAPVLRAGAGTSLTADGNGDGPPGLKEDERFGWVILPRYRALDGRKAVYIQGVSQYALSALLSIPSWWSDVKLEITRSWLDPDGTTRDARTTVVNVQLQPDFDALEGSLLVANQLGPVLMETQQDPVLLTACASASIIIPGRRLWRSSVVTLGSQTADEISVLPNMKGIVAKFREVENQSSEAERDLSRDKGAPFSIPRTVRVWTSQGSIALPNRAQIVIPKDCMPPRARS